MNNYILQNCPAYLKYNKCLHNGHCDNITDCVMKQIVFFCKMDVGSKDNMLLIPRYALADLILELLEIEEVDE